ncbi:hypothetical protein [Bacillus sp. FJAT-50079]|nr:hypothetical protein [Bacillus sp. FJAT-50079]MBS4209232.1 hypothetical protein [Bacillus sp. FJAT-50079]
MELGVFLGIMGILGVVGAFLLFIIGKSMNSEDASTIDELPQNDFNQK